MQKNVQTHFGEKHSNKNGFEHFVDEAEKKKKHSMCLKRLRKNANVRMTCSGRMKIVRKMYE